MSRMADRIRVADKQGLPGTFWKLKETPAETPCERVLARFQWADGLAFVSHGVYLGIRVNDLALQQTPELIARLRGCFPPGGESAESLQVECLYSLATVADRSRQAPGYSHFLYRGSCRLAHSRDIGEILTQWESDLHLQVAARSEEQLFVHAGVVGWNGRAVILPGRSFSGKTTLVAALIEAGATYLSDEYAVFDINGQVHPYAKRVSLRDKQGRPLERLSAEALGGQIETGPLPVGLLLYCRYEMGASWRPRALSAGRVLLALLDNTVSVRHQPQKTLETLREVVSAAPGFTSRRGDVRQIVAWLQTRDTQSKPIETRNDTVSLE